MSDMQYKPHIDGLRAIAVVSVMVYHLKFVLGGTLIASGGFLGVDVFFVLSGYLITRILLQEGRTRGRIDLGRFYARRARRILPPLLLVMLCSLPLAWHILSPAEIERFAGSLLASLFFLSNVFWFFELGEYGSQSGLLQPFLHTWSLAIEEQFYLVFPLLLIALFRFGKQGWLAGILIALAVLSLGAAHATTLWQADLSFFSPISRAWEMLAGSLLAWWSLRPGAQGPDRAQGRRGPLWQVAGLQIVALGVLVWLMATTHLSQAVHPGLITMPVILATCVLLHLDDPRAPVTRLLSSRPFVHLGKLSYSLYLWHYPIFAFARLNDFELPGPVDYALWLLLTWALALGGYHLIEKPFRFRLSTGPFVAGVGTGLASVCAFCLAIYGSDIEEGRMGDLAALYGDNAFDNEMLRDQSWSLLDALDPTEEIGTWNAHGPSRHEAEALWFAQADSQKVLVLGNSHSKDVYNSLALNAEGFAAAEFARFGMRTDFPEPQIAQLIAAPNFQAADVVLVASRLSNGLEADLARLIEAVRAAGKHIVLIGPGPEFKSPGAVPIFDWFVRRWGMADIARLNPLAYKFEDHRTHPLADQMAQVATRYQVPLLPRRALVCEDDQARCALVTEEGRKSYYDTSHWTLEGARFFGRRAIDSGWQARWTPPDA